MPFPIQPLRHLSETVIGMPDACEIQRFTWTEDDDGNQVQTWATVAETKCRRAGLGGTETAVAGMLASESSERAFFPHTVDLRPQDRVLVGEDYYEVEFVQGGSPSLRAHVE